MSKKRTTAGQRNISRARATRRPVAATSVTSAAKRSRFSLSPTVTRWLRTSKIPIIIAALVLVAILVAMFFRLTDVAPAAARLPLGSEALTWDTVAFQAAVTACVRALPLPI